MTDIYEDEARRLHAALSAPMSEMYGTEKALKLIGGALRAAADGKFRQDSSKSDEIRVGDAG